MWLMVVCTLVCWGLILSVFFRAVRAAQRDWRWMRRTARLPFYQRLRYPAVWTCLPNGQAPLPGDLWVCKIIGTDGLITLHGGSPDGLYKNAIYQTENHGGFHKLGMDRLALVYAKFQIPPELRWF